MTESDMAELCRKAAALSTSGRTFWALSTKAAAWDLKFNPDQLEIRILPSDFANDDLIVEEIRRHLDAIPVGRKPDEEPDADDRLGAIDS
jgi:hypothetical protein